MIRSRRLRSSDAIRKLVREINLSVDDFIYPLFIVEGEGVKEEISAMPGVYHYSVDMLSEELKELNSLGLDKILLFGLPDHKDEIGSEAYSDEGIVQKAIREVKRCSPSTYVITDVCMCQYTDHGHCGILDEKGIVLNDTTLNYLAKIAISHAKAGADMVAPSDMMDLRIKEIRDALDANDYTYVSIMAYSAKYASSFYGPFREAAHSSPSFGDRKTYQMDYANRREAIIEVESDIVEGADIVMVKPALSYLDIIRDIRDNFDVPVAAYNVSGEYSMLKNAVNQGLVNDTIIEEVLTSIKRAGAEIIISYFAKEIAYKLKGE